MGISYKLRPTMIPLHICDTLEQLVDRVDFKVTARPAGRARQSGERAVITQRLPPRRTAYGPYPAWCRETRHAVAAGWGARAIAVAVLPAASLYVPLPRKPAATRQLPGSYPAATRQLPGSKGERARCMPGHVHTCTRAAIRRKTYSTHLSER